MFLSLRALSFVLPILIAFVPSAAASVRYVRRDAGAGGDGTSWATAFQRVQDALAVAQSGDQVWVAKATYRPGSGASPRSVRFEIPGGISLYGGFVGNESSLGERNWVANVTVLSGDLMGDDGPDFTNRDDNCYHVVKTMLGATQPMTIDGFTIRGGHANSTGDDGKGAGVFTRSPSLTLRNVVLTENEALGGGGVHAADGHAKLFQCTLRGNRAVSGGGGYFFSDSTLVGCLVTGNVATVEGGGIRTDGNATISNVTIAFNEGGGVLLCCPHNTAFIRNSIVWGNSGTQYSDNSSGQSFCNIQGGPGLELDPLWVDPLGPDGVAGTGDEDFRLSCLSPLIDRGSNAYLFGATVDLAGNPRQIDDPATPDLGFGTAPIVDLGPYEFVCGCDEATNYCTALPNTSGLAASIGWSGSTSIFANDFTLLVTEGPPLKPGLFYYGPLQVSLPWGDGIRCVGGEFQRLTAFQLDASGAGSFHLDFTGAPAGSGPHQLFPGDTTNFQFYFRDPEGGPFGWNYSDALQVVFCR